MVNTRVKEVMITLDKYPHVPYWHTLLQAMEVMINAVLDVGGRQSLPRVLLILGDDDNLVGMVGRRNILRGLEPRYLVKRSLQTRKKMFDVKTDPRLTELQSKRIIRGVMERAERPVGDVMVPVRSTIDYNDHIFKAVYEMNEHRISLLPVLREGKVVGVVRTVEIFHAIADSLLKQEYIW